MIQSDKLEAEKADAKNSVEEYVYDMRDKLEVSLSQFVNDEVPLLNSFFDYLSCMWYCTCTW